MAASLVSGGSKDGDPLQYARRYDQARATELPVAGLAQLADAVCRSAVDQAGAHDLRTLPAWPGRCCNGEPAHRRSPSEPPGSTLHGNSWNSIQVDGTAKEGFANRRLPHPASRHCGAECIIRLNIVAPGSPPTA